MVPEAKDHIKMDDKKSSFAGLHTYLSMKLPPKATQGITLKIWYNRVDPVLLGDFVNISLTASQV